MDNWSLAALFLFFAHIHTHGRERCKCPFEEGEGEEVGIQKLRMQDFIRKWFAYPFRYLLTFAPSNETP